MKSFVLVFVCLCFPALVFAQKSVWDVSAKGKEKLNKQVGKSTSKVKRWKDHIVQWGMDSNYTHTVNVGGRLNTNGWSGLVSYHKNLGAGKSRFMQLSFSEIKHEKQIKQQRDNTAFPELGASTPFVFGKINNLYTLQLSYGREQLLLPGVLDGNISVGFRYSGGVSVAMLKPYYLRIIHVDYVPEQVISLKEEKYGDDNADLFLQRESILGASKWSKGLGEMKYIPGAFVEGAFTIVPAKNKALIQVITLGGQFAFYADKLPVMAERKAYNYQGCLFVGLMVGKRW